MIDAIVEAELILHVCALLLSTRDADGARALEFGDLANQRTDRSGCGRYHDRFARLRLADLEQSRVSRHAGHSENAKRGRGRSSFWIELTQALAVRDRVGLPASVGEDDIPGR